MLAFPQKLPTQGVCSLNPTSHKTDGVASVPTSFPGPRLWSPVPQLHNSLAVTDHWGGAVYTEQMSGWDQGLQGPLGRHQKVIGGATGKDL